MSVDDTALRGPRRPGVIMALVLIAALVFAGFMALGVWQLKRLAWKQALIARVEQTQTAAPVMAPGPSEWAGLRPADAEYRRVTVRGRFDHGRQTLVQASTTLGAGWWVMTPLRTEAGWWVLVNRGFVPTGWRETSAPEPASSTVVGLLRPSEQGGRLFLRNDPAAGRWYARDVEALARARGLAAQGGPVAPFFIDAVDPLAKPQALNMVDTSGERIEPRASAAPDGTVAGGPWPRPGLTVLRFSNNHLMYALTWFALAAMVLGAAGHVLREERRLRRSAGDLDRAHPSR